MTDILCVVYTLPQNAVWWPCLLNARRYGGHAHRMRAGMVAMLTEYAPVWWTCSQNACRYGGHVHRMYALCVSGPVNTPGFVWTFICAINTFSVIRPFTVASCQQATTVVISSFRNRTESFPQCCRLGLVGEVGLLNPAHGPWRDY